MTNITEILTIMGKNLPLVTVGCAELIAAVALLGKGLGKQNKPKSGKQISAKEREILDELENQTEETALVLKKDDLMPVYAGKNLTQVTGLTIESVHEDVTTIWKIIKDQEKGKRYWKQYREWDGQKILKEEFQIRNGEWMQMQIERSQNGLYDIMTFHVITEIHDQIESYEKKIIRLEGESQSKTTFLSRMSHEIRTPMNGII